MAFSFRRTQRLLKTDDFSSVFRLRSLRSNQWVQVYACPNTVGQARLGLVVGKKVAKRAIKRNYMKRTARETFRLCAARLGSVDFVVRVRQPFDRRHAAEVRSALRSLFTKLARCHASSSS